MERRVDRGALGESALVGVAALDVGNGARAAEHGAHTAVLARLGEGSLDELLYALVAGEVAVDVGLRIGLGNA